MATRHEGIRRVVLGAAAALLSAVALWHATGLFPAWWLTWLAPWPVLAFALRATAPAAAAAAFAAWAGGGLNLWHYYRTTLGVPLPIALAAIALPAAIFAAGVSLARLLARGGRPLLASLALPVWWTTFELAMARLSPHGTFGSLAYSQLDFLPIVQLAALCGSAGVSFLLLLPASALAVATLPAAAAARVRIVLTAAGLVAAALVFGLARLRGAEGSLTSLRVGLVAADAPDQPLPVSTTRGQELVAGYAAATEALLAAGVDVVVLPETIVRARDSEAEALLARLAGAQAERAATVVVGIDLQEQDGERNVALALEPGATTPFRYAKRHLLPPFEARYRPGTGLVLVPVRSVPAGLAICKDLDFPPLGREYARRGAGLLLVPAWDFGVDGWLHSRMAALRGVEGGFAVARSARGGRLTVSDDRGRLVAESTSDSAPVASLRASVRVGSPGTPYARLGDWLGWLACGLVAFAIREAARLRP
ncbi:MAG: nitrilase-related carbon-nitrogen hydrolase [Betaproteobacteria bacterium]